jgi:hypothetical protein
MRGGRIGAVALLGLRVTLPRQTSDGAVLEEGGYRLPFRMHAPKGGEYHHAMRAGGMEDFVRFETRPEREELAYSTVTAAR